MKRITVTEKEAGTEFRLQVGDEITVRLEAIPGTGYSWQIVGEAPAGLSLAGEPVFERSGEKLLGGVQQQVFDFQVTTPGTRRLELEYRRPWEKAGKGIKSFTIAVIAGGE